MKPRTYLALFSVILVFILFARYNNTLRNVILDFINPVKENYKIITKDIEETRASYLSQHDAIRALQKENLRLQKYLLNQANYLQQVSTLYKALPSLVKEPYKSVTLVNTISYVKLNKFDEILLTIPKNVHLEEKKLYGLIQNDVAAGTARLQNSHLYGYLLSNPFCRFSVFIGKERIPGIAEGSNSNSMIVKFIPKWSKVTIGDQVETSGLDGIFFSHVPVGIVTKVTVEESYKKAYIQTYADMLHPSLFFLITDPKPYVAAEYEPTNSFPNRAYPFPLRPKEKMAENNISSVPVTFQTKDNTVDPSAFDVPKDEIKTEEAASQNTETTTVKKPIKRHKPYRRTRKPQHRQSAKKPPEREKKNYTPKPKKTPKKPASLSPLDILRQ